MTYKPSLTALYHILLYITAEKNEQINNNANYIKSFRIGDEEYALSKGINAIIGDNGAGKSLLLSVLSGTVDSHYRSIVKANTIERNVGGNLQNAMIKTIKQDSIVEQVRTGDLFKGSNTEYFTNIDSNDAFKSDIQNYFDDLCKFVNNNISLTEERKSLDSNRFHVQLIDKNFYYPVIHAGLSLEDFSEDEDRKNALLNIYRDLVEEIYTGADYYAEISVANELEKLFYLNELKKRKRTLPTP